MMKFSRHGAFPGSPHPHLNEALLIAYLDGELARVEREAARDHLETCWTCRGLLTEIENSIDAFLEIRTSLLPEESAFSETRVEQFRQRLARHASSAENQAVPMPARLARAWLQVVRSAAYLAQPRQAAIAGFLVVTMLVIMFTDTLNTRVSADTVLTRVSQYEETHSPAQGQVSRTSMRVERIDHKTHAASSVKRLGTLIILHDSLHPEMYVQAEASSGRYGHGVIGSDESMNENLLSVFLAPEDAAFEQYILKEGWVPDLSVRQFRRLGEVPGSSLSASKDEGELDVSYRFAANPAGVAEALLQVNPADYAPTSISFVTAAEGVQYEYRFTRTAFSMEPRTPEIAELFVPIAAVPETTTEARKLLPFSKPAPLSYAQSPATAEEVAVAAALHKADACLGEEVYVFPMSDGTLLVQGLVDDNARREAIVRSLKPVAHNVRIEIYLPREIKRGSDLYNPPEQFSERLPAGPSGEQDATLADLSSGQSPLYERLNHHFSQAGISHDDADKQVDVFSSEMVTIARQTFLHAWALKRLDGEFSRSRTVYLSAAELQEIDQMRQDHRRWISTLARRESEMLAPIVGPATTASTAASAAAQDTDTDTLLALARTQNELVRALFADPRQAAQADTNLSRLLTVVRRMGS